MSRVDENFLVGATRIILYPWPMKIKNLALFVLGCLWIGSSVSALPVRCKDRFSAVYLEKNGQKNFASSISIKEFFHGTNRNFFNKIYKKASEIYDNDFYSQKPGFESAVKFTSRVTNRVTGYVIPLGMGSDEGSVVFTFDA